MNLQEINELRARLDQLERAQVQVSRKMTDDERRATGAALKEYAADWEAETAGLRRDRDALATERQRIEAEIETRKGQLQKIGDRVIEIQHRIDVSAERYRELRDPLLRDLQAGTADLTRELIERLEAEEAGCFRVLPRDAMDLTADLRSDIAARDRRVAALRALREHVERTLWKDTDASEGELRSRFERALANIPRLEYKHRVSVDEQTEFARAGGGLWPAGRVTH